MSLSELTYLWIIHELSFVLYLFWMNDCGPLLRERPNLWKPLSHSHSHHQHKINISIVFHIQKVLIKWKLFSSCPAKTTCAMSQSTNKSNNHHAVWHARVSWQVHMKAPTFYHISGQMWHRALQSAHWRWCHFLQQGCQSSKRALASETNALDICVPKRNPLERYAI